jgi:hypothetical protein
MTKASSIQTAKQYLAEVFPESLTPSAVCERADLPITSDTLARKFRAAAKPKEGQPAELLRSYYINDRGEEIATYSYNPAFHQAGGMK